MLEVQIENIIPVTEARDRFNQIIDSVEGTEELYVLTKNGKPAAIVVGIHHLEKLTGEAHTAVFGTESNPAPQAATPSQPVEPIVSLSPEQAQATPAPVSDAISAPAPVTDLSSVPAAPAQQPSAAPATSKLSSALTFDGIGMSQQTPVAPMPVSIPADDVSTNTPIDSPLIDTSANSSAGQAIAPDAVTPDQVGPSADPFAIPSEPLDLPEDNQVQAAPPAGQAQ